jgi:CMP-N-acetylneuraminate monooxygenase
MSFLESLILASHKYDLDTTEVLKSIDEIQDGESQDDNFLYFRCGENIKIYDRVCDHNGGRLSIKEGGASCPLHGWKLDLSNGLYTNARCSKKTIL